MVRSIARSLGRSASAAARAVGGRATKSAAEKTPVKKTSATKAPAKKSPPKKGAAKKTPAKKATAKKAPAKKPAVKKAPATKAPVKRTAAKKTAAKKTAAKKTAAKKTAAKKTEKTSATRATVSAAAARALPVRAGESDWTKAELAAVVSDLQAQREHSLELASAQSDELSGLMGDAGDGAGHDQADVGSTTFERDHEMTILASEREKLEQIDRALARIEDGTYGTCESCGEPVGKMRSMAFPRATLCMTCKQREERR